MKWEGRRQSSNVDDKRGMSTTGKVVAGGGAVGIIFLIIQLFLGGDNQQLLQALESQLNQGSQTTIANELTPEEKALGEYVATVLADTEDIWHRLFKENGRTYKEPKLTLFKNGIRSGCGGADASSGPFYCPQDMTVYMDLAFFELLQKRFGAKGGDFAIAYVISHEVGHHVQHLLGILSEVQQIKQKVSQTEGNKVSVALELQADFYAGVWAHHNKHYLEEGDIEEAMSAAAAVGNDAMQKKMQGHTNPDSFTHGTSEQRMYWFKRGFTSGDLSEGDTFAKLLN